MYYTVFLNRKGEEDLRIIHESEARIYGENHATYENYVQVKRRPSYEEAKTIFSIVNGNKLCAGILDAITVKIKK